jgi:hypothetical protein
MHGAGDEEAGMIEDNAAQDVGPVAEENQASDVVASEEEPPEVPPTGSNDEEDRQKKDEQLLWVAAWAKLKIDKDKIVKFSSEWEDKLVAIKDFVENKARQHINGNGFEQFAGCSSAEEVSKIFVKESILHAESSYDLLQRAELLIDTDWLVTVDELPGNIYRMSAFNEFVPVEGAKQVTWGEWLSARSRQAGFLMILLIQFIGPPLVFASTFGVGVQADRHAYKYEFLWNGDKWDDKSVDYFYDWRRIATTKFLGLVFMFAFILNAVYVALDEADTFNKIYSTFTYLKENTPKFKVEGHSRLLLGAFMDCWVVFWCSMDAFLIIGASSTPKDLLLDALGLIFLYNLDDIGGDFGFVDDDDWAGDRLGWVYDQMVNFTDERNDKRDKPGYQMQDENEAKQAQADHNAVPIWVGLSLYKLTAAICGFLAIAEPIAAIFVPFLMIAPQDD